MYGSLGAGSGTMIVTLLVLFVLFLILREFNCWYWKINRRISLMEEQNRLLRQLAGHPATDAGGGAGAGIASGSDHPTPASPAPSPAPSVRYVKCRSCGDLNADGVDACRSCGKPMRS